MEISVVIPDNAWLTDRPKSENPLINPAIPDKPLEVSNSGTARVGVLAVPVGILKDNEEGSGLISARTERLASLSVGAWATLILMGFGSEIDIYTVPIPANPKAPSSWGAIHPISFNPEILDDRLTLSELGSLWNRKWSPVIVRGIVEFVIWASIVVIGVSEFQEMMSPNVEVKDAGKPMKLAAWYWSPLLPAYFTESIPDDAEYWRVFSDKIIDISFGKSEYIIEWREAFSMNSESYSINESTNGFVESVNNSIFCWLVSLLSINDAAIKPPNLRLAAIGTSGSTGPFAAWIKPKFLSFDIIIWSPEIVGCGDDPILNSIDSRGIIILDSRKSLVINRLNDCPSKLPELDDPLSKSTISVGTSFSTFPVSRKRFTRFKITESTIFEMKSKSVELSKLVSGSVEPPNSKEP